MIQSETQEWVSLKVVIQTWVPLTITTEILKKDIIIVIITQDKKDFSNVSS